MRILAKSKLLLSVLAVVGPLAALPAAAQATLAFVKQPLHRTVYAAEDNGKQVRKIGPGSTPRVSPNGQLIAYDREKGSKQELRLMAASGAGGQTLMGNLQESFYVTFSPDSTLVAALRGPEIGKRKLVVINVANGTQSVVASGYFSGFSFSPDSREIVYAKANAEKYPLRSDVFRSPVGGGAAVRLTKDHVSQNPLWGPSGTIVFVKQLDAKKRKYGPKNELFLMNSEGGQVKRLTHTKVDPLLVGLYPTQWSANGSRLLTEFEGQDTSYAVAVNPKTGAQRPVDKAGEQGFVGTAISQDGTTVLGFTGGFEPGPNHSVVTVPYGGGKKKVLAKNAYEPSWSR